MTDPPDAVRRFVVDQVERLGDLDFVSVGSPESPFLVLQIARNDTGQIETRVPPRAVSTPLKPEMRTKLLEAGFACDDPSSPQAPWLRTATSPEEAFAIAEVTLRDVFDVAIADTVNLIHGSHRAEHEASQRLEKLRTRIEPVVSEMLGRPAARDKDGDYLYPIDHVHVIIAPRVIPGAVALVRIIAITNGGVTVAPELGLLLARLNFGLMFGRFALDSEHRSIWFDETLLGDDIGDEQLRFTVKMVAETAAEWAPKLQQMFGGLTHRDLEEAERQATPKPGASGYL